MQHPIFLNRQSIAVYFGLWILVAGIHVAVYYFIYLFPIEISVADSLVYNSIFSAIGISMWFIVRYTLPDRNNIWNVSFTHVAFLVLTLAVWHGVSYTLLNLIFGSNKAYVNFLNVSLPNKMFIGIVFYVLIGMAYYLYIYNKSIEEKAKVESRLREVLKETELNMLKAQINPHFLFNSLNSISSLTITNPEKAREMVIKLSDFLRYSVSSNTNSITTLENELSNIRRYLEIEKVRFGEKLQFGFQLQGECLKCKVPSMLLQPLFENAIKHGVYESTEQVSIDMDCECRDEFLEIVIVNDFDPAARPRKGSGIGLNNIRERLKLLYKNDKLLKTEIKGTRFTASLSIPKNF
jgi:sensor histidine kinase YesM